MSIEKMIQEHPDVAASGDHNETLGLAVRHAMYCAAICNSCADACSAEEMDMRRASACAWIARTYARRHTGWPRAAPTITAS